MYGHERDLLFSWERSTPKPRTGNNIAVYDDAYYEPDIVHTKSDTAEVKLDVLVKMSHTTKKKRNYRN